MSQLDRQLEIEDKSFNHHLRKWLNSQYKPKVQSSLKRDLAE